MLGIGCDGAWNKFSGHLTTFYLSMGVYREFDRCLSGMGMFAQNGGNF